MRLGFGLIHTALPDIRFRGRCPEFRKELQMEGSHHANSHSKRSTMACELVRMKSRLRHYTFAQTIQARRQHRRKSAMLTHLSYHQRWIMALIQKQAHAKLLMTRFHDFRERDKSWDNACLYGSEPRKITL